jgi:hypothetical protein
MHYPDGQLAHVGDEVQLWNGATGVVVCSLDTVEYTTGFPEAEWRYLKSGVLIRSPQAGLIHYLEPEASFQLIARGRSTEE